MLLSISFSASSNDLLKLYDSENELEYNDLVIEVKGYKVPTRAAFRGWMLMNRAEGRVGEIAQQLRDAGITEEPLKTMPLHLILLQGTNWAMNGTSVFTVPDQKRVPNMVRTVKFIQEHVEPVLGPLVPVSGDRTQYYNQTSGGATKSQHLNFCALDLVPINDITREELHKKLWSIYKIVGKENKMGMGLYSGVRFHIDTCGYRNW
ncbi:D-Ala-D-Ala carboxypeptidase family metallohydrolase [Vibrio breoganii]|uniref:D-Ala-D-Ala carboxypeptidase family metallohydrolase n=1 Tax=Vibrio breoganii TaxID=553239 RepID=UPI0021C3EAA1|nr:D-Ala-D-Ala carboxypeptidase family metallohydrolase [Vibrio breoganii]MDN3715904.1 D-Ala-D-Ala carboxypeptidase family metallohydrolase [Vibrio breoganii]